DGSYTIQFDEGRNGATHASPIDLYMMGLIDASQVNPILAYSGAFKQPSNPVVQASEIAKTVTIEDIIARPGARTPGPGGDPRATAVNQVRIVFSDPATGFDLSDLRLTRDGGSNLLTGAETLSSTDGITWTLSGLSGLTGALGNYQLALSSGSGIQGPDGKP